MCVYVFGGKPQGGHSPPTPDKKKPRGKPEGRRERERERSLFKELDEIDTQLGSSQVLKLTSFCEVRFNTRNLIREAGLLSRRIRYLRCSSRRLATEMRRKEKEAIFFFKRREEQKKKGLKPARKRRWFPPPVAPWAKLVGIYPC